MTQDNETNLKLAVLIDADNTQADMTEALLAEIAKFGIPVVKRIYGDFTRPHLKAWRDLLNQHAIIPVQQFNYTTGKNSSDTAMIIDAMDLLHNQTYDGFCLVSSDSDFTKLASRIRQDGKLVYGFGRKHTPQAFIAACDQFIFLENIAAGQEDDAEGKAPRQADSLKSLVKPIRQAIDATSDDSGWTLLSKVGTLLITKNPEFDPRTYGFRKLSDLAEAIRSVEVKKVRGSNNSPSSIIYVKNK